VVVKATYPKTARSRKVNVSLDITVLQLLKHRDKYEKLAKHVPVRALESQVQIIFSDFGSYFKEFPECKVIDSGPFMLWFKGFKHKGLKDEACAVIDGLMRKACAEDVSTDVAGGIMKRLVEAGIAADLADVLLNYSEGGEVDIRANLMAAMDSYDSQVVRVVKNPQVLDRIEDLLKAEENDTGLHWRLPCLNRHIKPLQPGDFVVIAARPDKGKTTFCASELTHMAAQVDGLYPWTDEKDRRSILWFNNEGPGSKIVTRCFQAALNATTEELVAKSNAGTIRQEYAAALGGRGGTLRIFNIHGMRNDECEELIELHKPALVLWDMIDNVTFAGSANNNGQRTDQLLESMYQWVRMMGVKHDCAQMATSQISGDGDGIQWPTLGQLKDSKTGKQGAADVIITIGTVNDPVLAKSRYMGTTKNKKVRSGVPSSPMTEVIFDGDRGRYVEHSQ
jgi:replicative DNA helicase